MGQLQSRRSSIEIIADILRLLRLGYASRIEITHVSQITSEQSSKYINELIETGILEDAAEKMGLPAFRITRKGLALLDAIESLRENLPEDGVLDILHKSKITEINIGKVYLTRRVLNQVQRSERFTAFVQKSLDRYRKGDWGEKSYDERLINEKSRESGRLLLSSYESQGFPEIWITTSPGREYTTVMFPDEEASMEPLEPYEALNASKSRL